MKTVFLVVAAVAVIVLALAFFWGVFLGGFAVAPAVQDTESVTIGVMLSLTGDAAVYGESIGTALELAREEINAQGGILGKKVEFAIEDSACNAKMGADAMNNLVNLKKMKIVISGDCSGPTLSAAPIAEQKKVLFLVSVATAPDIKYAGNYVFRSSPSDSQQGKDLARLVYTKGYRSIAVLFMDNAYAKGIESVFAEEFAVLGGKIAVAQAVNQADADFRTPLLKLKESGHDSVLIIGYPQLYHLAIKQFYELGMKEQIFATETFEDAELLNALGDKAEGIFFTALAKSSSASFVRFKENYRKKFGKEFGPYGDYGYDSLFVLKAGIEQANSFDPEILKKSLYSLEYTGVTGKTAFNSFGEVDKPYGVMTVKNGRFVS